MIKLDEEYYLDANELQFYLKKKHVVEEGDNAGKVNFVTVGSYPSLRTVAIGLSDRKLYELAASLTSLKALQDDFIAWADELKSPVLSELRGAVRLYGTNLRLEEEVKSLKKQIKG